MGWGIDAMVGWARFVGALPGAVASLPAMPDLAFRLMLCGGIWMAAWGTRWRWLGAIPILAGLALSPFAAKPDIFVGRDGKALAIRLPGEGLSAMALRGNSFDLARWLEADGDDRTVKAVARGKGFRCDTVGCTAEVGGLTLAIALTDAALVEDCRRAAILVVKFPGPRNCTTPQLKIDSTRLRIDGAHAIYLGEGGMRVATVEGLRGDRPWSPRPKPLAPRQGSDAAARSVGGADEPDEEDMAEEGAPSGPE